MTEKENRGRVSIYDSDEDITQSTAAQESLPQGDLAEPPEAKHAAAAGREQPPENISEGEKSERTTESFFPQYSVEGREESLDNMLQKLEELYGADSYRRRSSWENLDELADSGEDYSGIRGKKKKQREEKKNSRRKKLEQLTSARVNSYGESEPRKASFFPEIMGEQQERGQLPEKKKDKKDYDPEREINRKYITLSPDAGSSGYISKPDVPEETAHDKPAQTGNHSDRPSVDTSAGCEAKEASSDVLTFVSQEGAPLTWAEGEQSKEEEQSRLTKQRDVTDMTDLPSSTDEKEQLPQAEQTDPNAPLQEPEQAAQPEWQSGEELPCEAEQKASQTAPPKKRVGFSGYLHLVEQERARKAAKSTEQKPLTAEERALNKKADKMAKKQLRQQNRTHKKQAKHTSRLDAKNSLKQLPRRAKCRLVLGFILTALLCLALGLLFKAGHFAVGELMAKQVSGSSTYLHILEGKREAQSRLDELEQQIEQKQQEIEDAQQQLDDAQEYFDNRQKYEDELASIMAQIESANDELAAKQQEIDALLAKLQTYTGQLAEEQSKGYEMSAGVYYGDDDIAPGLYDITLVSGTGNVYIKDAGGSVVIAEMFGAGGVTSYKNASITWDCYVEITGNVVVKFTERIQ